VKNSEKKTAIEIKKKIKVKVRHFKICNSVIMFLQNDAWHEIFLSNPINRFDFQPAMTSVTIIDISLLD
jgi:hypothetical protein